MPSPRPHAAAALVVALLLAAPPCGAQGREIEAALAGEGRTDALAPAAAAARAGRLFLALHLAREPWADARASSYVRANAASARDAASFETEWRRMGKSLAAREKRPDTAAKVPAVVRALAQVSRQQSRPFYEGGLLYGQNTTLENGLYYVGLAAAYVEFAAFVEGLPFAAPKPPPAVGRLAPAIARLEGATVDAYERAGEKERRRFIDLNVALKVASECEATDRREGALYETLEAALALGLAAGPPAARPAGELRRELDRHAARLAASQTDQSIGRLYVEMALASLDAPAAPGATDVAAVIVRDVLPLYEELVPGVKP